MVFILEFSSLPNFTGFCRVRFCFVCFEFWLRVESNIHRIRDEITSFFKSNIVTVLPFFSRSFCLVVFFFMFVEVGGWVVLSFLGVFFWFFFGFR